MKLQSSETLLQGKCIFENNLMRSDETSKRIECLISSYLTRIKADETGWNILYQDPSDMRYWELYYPQSNLHGGGPPSLRYITIEEAKLTFGI